LARVRPKLSLASADRPLKSLLHPLMERGLVEKKAGGEGYGVSAASLSSALLKSANFQDLEKIHRAWLETLDEEKDPSPQKIHHALFLKEEGRLVPQVREQCEAFGKEGQESRALRMLDRALPLIHDKAERSRLLRLKTNLLIGRGRNLEALEPSEGAFALQAPGEPLPLKSVKYWLASGVLHQNLGNFPEGIRRLSRCVEEAKNFNDRAHDPFVVQAHAQLGRLDLEKGDLSGAKKHFEGGLQRAGLKGR